MSSTYLCNPTSSSTYVEVYPPTNIYASSVVSYFEDQAVNYSGTGSTNYFCTNLYGFSTYSNGSYIYESSGNTGYPLEGSFSISVNSTTFLVYPMICQYFGPNGSSSGWEDPYNNWASDPLTYYSSTTWSSSYGPAITNALANNTATYSYPSVFYINPSLAQLRGGSEFKVPTYSYVGSPYFSTNGNANTSSVNSSNSNSQPTDWALYYQMNNTDACGTSSAPSPIMGNIGFPYYDSFFGPTFMYFQVIFAMPLYGASATTSATIPATLSTEIYSGWSTNSFPTYPNYLLAFYNRSVPYCDTSPYLPVLSSNDALSTSPYGSTGGYGNYYPVIYDPVSLSQQASGDLPESGAAISSVTPELVFNGLFDQTEDVYGYTTVLPPTTLLGILTTIYSDQTGASLSSSSTVHDYLVALGWLENINNATGVDFGCVQVPGSADIELGSGWFFAGFVPVNFATTDASTDWSSSVSDLQWYGGPITYMGENLVMATTVPLDSSGNPNCYNAGSTSNTDTSIGNYFWENVETSYNATTYSYNIDLVAGGGSAATYDISAAITGGYFSSFSLQDSSPLFSASIQNSDEVLAVYVYPADSYSGYCLYGTIQFTLSWPDGGVNGGTDMSIEIYNYTASELAITIVASSTVSGTAQANSYNSFRSDTGSQGWSGTAVNVQSISNNQTSV